MGGHLALDALAGACGIAGGIALALLARRHLRQPKNRKAIAVASALFWSFGFFNPRSGELVQETIDEARRKKDAQSGEPPSNAQ